ncbi:CoA transferase [Mesorhizobium sp. M0778]|uniref:CaiB/BaiF CoA transferase family protein n=1 Tax=Mesorhizobium sp. M0778 TaxID=2956999 RepID=UPI00333C5376
MNSTRPLEGIRVLEAATFIAAPFSGTILADFGAEVIKIEQPESGDPLRRFGTPSEAGDTLTWLSEGRNKKSVVLDLRSLSGSATFKRMVTTSHVVLENFRPGTLEEWGLSYDVLRELNPALVLLRISGYGQSGPNRTMPGFARVAHAFSGLSFLAGMPDGPPVVPGSTSLADYCSGLWGAVGVLIALRHAENSGKGQVIDLGLYESIFRLLDELVPVYDKLGEVRTRMGADVPHVVPHGHWQAGDGNWIALACSSDKIFLRLAQLIGRADLATSETFETGPKRIKGRAVINDAVAQWVGSIPSAEVIRLCNEAGVPCGPILNIAQIFQDPQYAARGNIERIQDERVGSLAVPRGLPGMSETPPVLRHLGRSLGADTDAVLSALDGDMPLKRRPSA